MDQIEFLPKIILNWPSSTRAALILLANIFIFDLGSVASLVVSLGLPPKDVAVNLHCT